MTTSKTSTTSLLTAVRWIARISSIPIIVIFLLMFFGEGFEPANVKPIEWLMLIFGPVGLVLGMLLGWWKEGLGGAVVILSLFASLIVGDYSGSGAGNMLICASPGFLFLLTWFFSKTAELPPEEDQAQVLGSSPTGTDDLETRKSRIEAGLCPKCGTPIVATYKNCPSCRINLAFAREHLAQLV